MVTTLSLKWWSVFKTSLPETKKVIPREIALCEPHQYVTPVGKMNLFHPLKERSKVRRNKKRNPSEETKFIPLYYYKMMVEGELSQLVPIFADTKTLFVVTGLPNCIVIHLLHVNLVELLSHSV